ncbi:MAG: hypothetical protein FD126_3529, partial [Elusimicrobia bacterium]
RCWSCGYGVEPKDRYCRWCGQGQGDYVPWRYTRGGILASALFFMGPFALILVRRSPLLSTQEKWVWAAVILAATAYAASRLYQALLIMKSVFGMYSGML